MEICKDRWGKLRNCFINALKRRHKKSGQASTKIVPWKYEAQMEFLRSHLEGRPTITNLSDVTDDSTQELQFSDETESSRFNATPGPSSFTVRTPTPSSSSVRTPTSSSNRNKKGNEDNVVTEMVNVIKSSQEARQKRMSEMDETDYFFLSMS